MILLPQFLQKQRNSIIFCTVMFTLLACIPVKAQHMIGIRSGYSSSGVHFKNSKDQSNINTPINFSLLYTYYHELWDSFPYFGIQTGINYAEQGFARVNVYDETKNDTTRYRVIEVPLISQFHIDFWKMRLLVNLGAFAGYRFNAQETFFEPTGERIHRDYPYDCYDIQFDYGFIGGGGLAFRIQPFEIHFECNYQYSLSMLYNPKILSNTVYTYTYPHQLTFSLALFFRL